MVLFSFSGKIHERDNDMDTKTRKQRDYKKLVAKLDDEYYFLDYIFEDGSFKGATGSVLRPVSKDEYESRINDPEYLEEPWQMAVEARQTQLGLDDWAELVRNTDGDDAFFDLSYMEYWPQLRELGYSEDEYPVFEASGGGRCFSKDQVFDHVYNKTLIKEINKVEQ